MKAKNILGLLLAVCLLASCEVNKKLEESRREVISLDNVPVTALEMEEIMIVPPNKQYDYSTPELYLVDDTLVVLTDMDNASSLRFFNLRGEMIGHSRIRKQEDLFALPVDPALRTSFAFKHPNTNIYYEYAIENGNLSLKDFTRMRLGENSPRQAVRLDEDHFAFIGQYKDGLFGVWEKPTRTLTFFGNYPIVEDYTLDILLPYFDGRIDRSGDQLVYVSYQFGFISSYNYNKGRLVRLWEKQIGDYLYRENSMGLVFDEKHKTGFIEVYFAGDYIYTLYNGIDETMGEEFTNSIVVFTKDKGKPVARYTLPDMMSYMKFDSKGEYAYATYSTYLGQHKVVRFKLPKL